MLYTNGKIVIHKTNNLDELKEKVAQFVNETYEKKHISLNFVFTEEYQYPAYIIPDGVTYEDMHQILSPNIALRAINENEIVLSGTDIVNKRYDFTEQEIHEIAVKNMQLLKRKRELEVEKASFNRKIADQLKEVEQQIFETVELHTNGYEYRDFPCKVKLNFSDGKKYYHDLNDETIVHKSEKLKTEEKQMKIDHRFEVPVEINDEEKFKIEPNFQDDLPL